VITLRSRVFSRGKVESLAFAPNGRTLAAPCGATGLVIWDDVTSGAEPRVINWKAQGIYRHGHTVISQTGERALCHTAPGPVLCDLQGDNWVSLYVAGQYGLNLATFGPDDSIIVVTNILAPGNPAGYRTRIDRRAYSDPLPEAAVWSVTVSAFTPHVPMFLASYDEVITLEHRWKPVENFGQWELFVVARDPATGQEVRCSPPGDYANHTPVASADDQFIATYSERFLTAWRVDDLSTVTRRLENSDPKHFTGIAFHPSGRYLAATSNDQTVKLYDTTTWQVAKTFTWNIGRMRSIAFSPDGTLAAAGSDTGKVVVWDVDV